MIVSKKWLVTFLGGYSEIISFKHPKDELAVRGALSMSHPTIESIEPFVDPKE